VLQAAALRNVHVFIKDSQHVRMSGRTTAVVSFFWDNHPEEVIADQVTTFFLYERSTVTSYMCVGSFDRNPIFLAKYTDSQRKSHEKTYVKTLVPNTEHLKNIDAQVLFLFCHGVERNKTSQNVSLLNFDGNDSVTIYGGQNPPLPTALTISSCREYAHDGTKYTAPVDVFLSEVVGQTKLVMLLCCYGADIVQEYASEESVGSNRPNFVIFKKETVDAISIQIFLTLLMLSMDTYKVSSTVGDWNKVLELHVQQVMHWTQKQNDIEGLWLFLLQNECVQQLTEEDHFRTKLSTERLSKAAVQEYLYDDLRSLTLMQWQKGGYTDAQGIDIPGIDFSTFLPRRSTRKRSAATDMHALLQQLHGLLSA